MGQMSSSARVGAAALVVAITRRARVALTQAGKKEHRSALSPYRLCCKPLRVDSYQKM